MERLLKVADLRDLEGQVLKGKISYSRMVEIINEKHFLALVNLRMELSPTKDKNHNIKAEKQHYDAPVSGKDALKDMPVTTMEEYFKLTPVSEKPEKSKWYHTVDEFGNADKTYFDNMGEWSDPIITHWLKPCSNPYKAEIEKLIEEMTAEMKHSRLNYVKHSECKYWKDKLTELLKTINHEHHKRICGFKNC